MTWQWRACTPGNQYAVCPWDGGAELPFSVCKIVMGEKVIYEAWARAPASRGGYWGGQIIGAFDTANDAKQWCESYTRPQQVSEP